MDQKSTLNDSLKPKIPFREPPKLSVESIDNPFSLISKNSPQEAIMILLKKNPVHIKVY